MLAGLLPFDFMLCLPWALPMPDAFAAGWAMAFPTLPFGMGGLPAEWAAGMGGKPKACAGTSWPL